MIRFVTQVAEDILDKIDVYAEEYGMSRAAVVREALDEFFRGINDRSKV